MTHSHILFDRFRFDNGLTLRNRVVMTPMTTWSANPDGTISDQEVTYVEERARDVGLVITGCTHVTPEGIGFTDEFAAYDDRFIPSLRKLAQAAKSGGAPANGPSSAIAYVRSREGLKEADLLIHFLPFLDSRRASAFPWPQPYQV